MLKYLNFFLIQIPFISFLSVCFFEPFFSVTSCLCLGQPLVFQIRSSHPESCHFLAPQGHRKQRHFQFMCWAGRVQWAVGGGSERKFNFARISKAGVQSQFFDRFVSKFKSASQDVPRVPDSTCFSQMDRKKDIHFRTPNNTMLKQLDNVGWKGDNKGKTGTTLYSKETWQTRLIFHVSKFMFMSNSGHLLGTAFTQYEGIRVAKRSKT